MRSRLYFWMRYYIVLFHIVWSYQILTFCAFCWSILTGITITNGLRLAKIPKIITLRHNIKPFTGSITTWLQTNSTFKSSTKLTSIRMCRYMTSSSHHLHAQEDYWFWNFVEFFEDFLACLHPQPPSVFTKATASLELEGEKVGNTQKSKEQRINTHTIIPYFVLSQYSAQFA